MMEQTAAGPPQGAPHPPRRRVLMTLDAVGGVWRYAMDLGASLGSVGFDLVFAGLGPKPTELQRAEGRRIGELVWLDAPLDWMAASESEVAAVPALVSSLVRNHRIDLLHLNLPSQAMGLDADVPVLAVSHSCVTTWFAAVRGTAVPEGWAWQAKVNALGFARADAVFAPSRSHADALLEAYGPIAGLGVIHNAVEAEFPSRTREPFVFAAGRWWDDGKNGRVLDEAAARIGWPVRMAGPLDGPGGASLSLRHAVALGELGNGAVRDAVSRAGIFVSPSLYEPFGLAALEAARSGAPMVLADIPTYRELWNGAALFADPTDPRSFADAIESLIGKAGLRRALGSRARVRSRGFSLEAQARGYGAAYDALLSRSRQPARRVG